MPPTSALPKAHDLKAHNLRAHQIRSHKLLGLEGLRFLATIAVLLWHYQHFAFAPDLRGDLPKGQLPFYRVLFPFYEAGDYGVWIFWCISGFIFFWKYRSIVADRTIGGWTFFVYRLSRLYPLHLATLLLVALLQMLYGAQHGFYFVYQQNDVAHFIAQLFMASNWLPLRIQSFNGPIWSVSVEVLAYAAFFLTLRFVNPSPLFNLAMSVLALRLGSDLGICLAFFYAGGLAAIVRRAVAGAPHRRLLGAAAACAAAMVPLAFWLSGAELASVSGPLMLMTTPLVLFCCSGELALPRWTETLLESAGNMTYSCYLLQFPTQLIIVLACTALQQPIPYRDHLFWTAYVLLTFTLAGLAYRYFEAPAQRLIRSALLRKREASQTSPALL
jgi:peptidoglycan/LPS O-acetylase OafA/YrhL